jgi:DNA-binding NtrC family response regulator
MTKKVLYIDDEFELWEGKMREQLSSFGFEIKGELEPDNALKCIKEYKPDVVLLDILFSDGKLGKIALEKIKKKYPALPVVMISAMMDKDDYNAYDYEHADFRYTKLALTDGDYSDLAAVLTKAIDKYNRSKITNQDSIAEDDTGLAHYGFIVGYSSEMKAIAETIDKIAAGIVGVLITGESGTGKELLAQAIHRLSDRKDKPFLAVVCAAMPQELIESELFGHEKGAFTGAIAQKKGKFELAEEGTIFIDEVSEIPIATQVKLLRFLQEKTFERVGGKDLLESKARIIAATNKNLGEEISKGTFREDLYYRLNVLPISLPPLRDRKEDIDLFFKYFVDQANNTCGKKVLSYIRDDVRSIFSQYKWPGNIREMQNVILKAVTLAEENILQVNNFSALVDKKENNRQMPSDISAIVDQIMKGNLTWDNLKANYGAKGPIRKEVLITLQKHWEQDHKRRPTSQELADLLKTSYNNIRRILSEYKIKKNSH